MATICVHVFQANNGDSFLVTIKDQTEINILIDCGSGYCYEHYIKPYLINMSNNNRIIDYLVLTHTHADHIGGAVKLLEDNRSSKEAAIININNIMYNGFLGLSLANYNRRECMEKEILLYRGICSGGKAVIQSGTNDEHITLGQEMCLSKLIIDGGYRWNDSDSCKELITDIHAPIELGKNVRMYILSPTVDNLKDMNRKWEAYLKKKVSTIDFSYNELVKRAYEAFLLIIENESYDNIQQLINKEILTIDKFYEISRKNLRYDTTTENSSSIALLLEVYDHKYLFLADANTEVCRKSLDRLYNDSEEVYFDLIKLSHHGSVRNLSKKFIQKYYSDKFLISSGSTSDRPSIDTFAKIMCERPDMLIDFYITNRNNAINEIDQEFMHQEFSFEIIQINNQNIIC